MNTLLFLYFLIILSKQQQQQQILPWNVTRFEYLSNPKQSQITTYIYILNASLLSNYDQYIYIEYTPKLSNSFIPSFIQINFNPLTQPSPKSKIILNLFQDKNINLFTIQTQYLLANVNQTNSQLFYIYLYVLNTADQYNFQFTLTPFSSSSLFCPKNCSGNGICKQGKCICQKYRYGRDCSIIPVILKNSQSKDISIEPFTINYILVRNLMEQQFNLKINCKIINSNNIVKVFLKKSTYSILGDRFQYDNFLQLSQQKSEIQFLNKKDVQEDSVLILNYGKVAISIHANVEDTEKQFSLLSVWLIVIGSIVTIVFIIAIVVFARRNRNTRRRRSLNYQNKKKQDNSYTGESFQKYFPSFQYKIFKILAYEISAQEFQNQKNLNKQECPICLDYITQFQLIIITYCKHIFHKQCFNQWLKKQQICPCCRQIHKIDIIQNLYNKYIQKLDQNVSDEQKKVYLVKRINEKMRLSQMTLITQQKLNISQLPAINQNRNNQNILNNLN